MTAASGSEITAPLVTRAGRVLGVVLFLLILLAPTPQGLSPEGQRVAAVTALMAVYWLTQAMPVAATSMIPLVAFPLLGIQTARTVSQSYINENVFLFLGGFVVALGIEKWGLHERMALHIVRLLGTGPRQLVLGFMLATAFLSMWISNTAATLLMLPIGIALLRALGALLEESNSGVDESAALRPLGVALALGIAYSASIGGFTTLVGTPTNVQFVQIWQTEFPEAPAMSAGEWMVATVPLAIAVLAVTWGLLCWRLPPLLAQSTLTRGFFDERLARLGRPSQAERLMMAVFGTTAALWLFRKPLVIGSAVEIPGWGGLVERWLLWLGADADFAATAIHDSTVAMTAALLLFLLPSKGGPLGNSPRLMDWSTMEKMPWAILLLFGGGFAIADGFAQSGFSGWIGEIFRQAVDRWPLWMTVAAACLLLTFLTEFTTNVATVSAILPILAETSVRLNIDPRLLMIPATISASCAFMLPIGTPPNAIVFSSGRIRISDMAARGLLLNLLAVVLVTAATFLIFQAQFGIAASSAPEWATAGP